MRKLACAMLVVGLVELLFPARAQAVDVWAHEHRVVVATGTFTTLVGDLTFSTYAFRLQPIAKPWLAATEIVLTAPQVPLMIWLGAGNPLDLDTPEQVLLIVGSAWPAFLAAHGLWSFFTAEEPIPPTHRAATFAPMAVSDGLRLAPGLGISGTF
jgi:hypothetical protein